MGGRIMIFLFLSSELVPLLSIHSRTWAVVIVSDLLAEMMLRLGQNRVVLDLVDLEKRRLQISMLDQ